MTMSGQEPKLVVFPGTARKKPLFGVRTTSRLLKQSVWYVFVTMFTFWTFFLVTTGSQPGYQWLENLTFLLFAGLATWKWFTENRMLRAAAAVTAGIVAGMGLELTSVQPVQVTGDLLAQFEFAWPILALWLGVFGVTYGLSQYLTRVCTLLVLTRGARKRPKKYSRVIALRPKRITSLKAVTFSSCIGACLAVWFHLMFDSIASGVLHYWNWTYRGTWVWQGVPVPFLISCFLVSWLGLTVIHYLLPIRRAQSKTAGGKLRVDGVLPTWLLYILMPGLMVVIGAHFGYMIGFAMWVFTLILSGGILWIRKLKAL